MRIRLELSDSVDIKSVVIGKENVLQIDLQKLDHLHGIIDIEERVVLVVIAHCLIDERGSIMIGMIGMHVICFEEVIDGAVKDIRMINVFDV